MRNATEPKQIYGLPHLRLLLLLLVLPAVAACGSTAGGIEGHSQATTGPHSGRATPARLPLQVAPTATPVPTELLPARLIIPRMELNAPIVPVGVDASGAMTAPYVANPHDPIWSAVYWWNLGVLPGQTGNAVIAGHVNRPDASSSTFTGLDRLEPGDQIKVVTTGGPLLTFVVTSKETPLLQEHDPGDPAFMRVFGPSLTANLNLITCWGEWIGHTFNRRLVIHTTLVGPSPFATGKASAPNG